MKRGPRIKTGWVALPGTYEHDRAIKIVPKNRNDPRYILFFSGIIGVPKETRILASYLADAMTLEEEDRPAEGPFQSSKAVTP